MKKVLAISLPILFAIVLGNQILRSCPWYDSIPIINLLFKYDPNSWVVDPNAPTSTLEDAGGDPINLKTGDYTQTVQDLFIRGRAVNIAIIRSYRGKPIMGGEVTFDGSGSYSPYGGSLDYLWTCSKAVDINDKNTAYAKMMFPYGGEFYVTLKVKKHNSSESWQ